jgi:transcriptional regulator with XRE-family HTH domain
LIVADRAMGLRREEVALLAGVSVDYYTRLERGNARGASNAVLDALACALQLMRPNGPVFRVCVRQKSDNLLSLGERADIPRTGRFGRRRMRALQGVGLELSQPCVHPCMSKAGSRA